MREQHLNAHVPEADVDSGSLSTFSELNARFRSGLTTNEPLNPDSGSFVTANPFRCWIWALNDRIKEDVTEASCRAEIESVARDGQLIPVIGRVLDGNPDFDIEIVCGTRRLFIARHLKIPLRVELRRSLTGRRPWRLRSRTPYASRPVRTSGVCGSRSSSSRASTTRSMRWLALGITPTQVTRLLKFAELPTIVISAFSSPTTSSNRGPSSCTRHWATSVAGWSPSGQCFRAASAPPAGGIGLRDVAGVQRPGSPQRKARRGTCGEESNRRAAAALRASTQRSGTENSQRTCRRQHRERRHAGRRRDLDPPDA